MARLGPQTANCMEFVLATPVVLWAGWPFFERGWRSLVTCHLTMFTLIMVGTGAAFLYSVAAVLAPGLFPAALRGHDGAVPAYFEPAAVITVLVLKLPSCRSCWPPLWMIVPDATPPLMVSKAPDVTTVEIVVPP